MAQALVPHGTAALRSARARLRAATKVMKSRASPFQSPLVAVTLEMAGGRPAGR
jgi:hypothetical protein